MLSLTKIRARLDDLLSDQRAKDEPPSTIILLPENGRGPDSDVRPYPRVNRVGRAAIIVYRPEDGQPTPEAIHQLLDESVRS